MKKEIKFLMILFVLLCNLSCSKSDSNPVNPNIVYKANLVGNNSIQTTNSTATGTATLTYNTTTKLFTLAVTYTGLTVTSSHIHKIGAGVIVAISPNVSPINFTSTTSKKGSFPPFSSLTSIPFETISFLALLY